ncbi:MAG: hypothetical protein ACO2O5_03315 [Candidatus Caldipriscus sp.]
MMWLISLPVAPMYGIWRGSINTPQVSTSYKPFSLDWLGVVDGRYWDYTITGILYGNGTERDSVFSVGVIGVFPYCTFSSSLPGANYQRFMNTDSTGPRIDTGFIYFRQGYDNLYGQDGIIVMKYNPSLGDNWQAWDTCLIRLNTRYPLRDIDGDGRVDTFWVKSSTARVASISGPSYFITISPLRYTVWSSLLSSLYFIDSIVVWDYYRFVFNETFGKVEEHLDSSRIKYYMFGFPVLDTAFRNLYHKVATTSISEASKEITPGDVKVYTADGRYVGNFVPNRKGIYFVVSNRTRKVIVR